MWSLVQSSPYENHCEWYKKFASRLCKSSFAGNVTCTRKSMHGIDSSMTKLSLLNCVPCVLKTCSRANVPWVLTCSRALRDYVLTYQRALQVYVLTFPSALRAYVLTCSRALRVYVLTCQRASFDATIFIFAANVTEVVHIVDNVQEFNYCLSSVKWIHI